MNPLIRVLSVFVATVLCCSLAACSGGVDDSSASDNPNAPSISAASLATTTTAAVGLIDPVAVEALLRAQPGIGDSSGHCQFLRLEDEQTALALWFKPDRYGWDCADALITHMTNNNYIQVSRRSEFEKLVNDVWSGSAPIGCLELQFGYAVQAQIGQAVDDKARSLSFRIETLAECQEVVEYLGDSDYGRSSQVAVDTYEARPFDTDGPAPPSSSPPTGGDSGLC